MTRVPKSMVTSTTNDTVGAKTGSSIERNQSWFIGVFATISRKKFNEKSPGDASVNTPRVLPPCNFGKDADQSGPSYSSHVFSA